MTPTKAAAISKRSFDSFNMFNDPKYITGIQGLGTVQPLHNTQQAYWAVKEESWKTCKWTATEKDFEKDSVLWNHTHRFNSGATEQMHAFLRPRIQIIFQSQILVVDDSILDERTGKTKNIIVGDLSMPEVAEPFNIDKEKGLKDPKHKRQYSTRTKYLVNILTKNNTPAHEVPIVLTVKGLASVDLSQSIKDFNTEMDKCLSMALGMDAGVKFDVDYKSLTVFVPELDIETKGKNSNSICVVKNYEKPKYDTQEEAQASVVNLTIPDEAREETWKQLKDPNLGNYINRHSQEQAAKLGGAYGIAEGVPALLPQGSVQVLPATTDLGHRDQDTGEINLTA